jgi:hypothetical protein
MQRGNSRLKASIFLFSSSKSLRKLSTFKPFTAASPIMETSLRKSVIVSGKNVNVFIAEVNVFVVEEGLTKSKLSSGGTEPIFFFQKRLKVYDVLIKKSLKQKEKRERCRHGEIYTYIERKKGFPGFSRVILSIKKGEILSMRFFCVNVMYSLSFLRIFYLFISITILPRSRFGPSRFYLV